MSEPQQPPAQPYGTPPHPAPQSPTSSQTPAVEGAHPAPPHYAGQQQHPAPPHYAGQQQHPAPPQFAGQPYGSQHPPAFAYPGPAAASPSSGGSLGRLAFIISLVALGIGLLVTLSFPLVIRSFYDASGIGAFGAIGNGLVLVVSVVALILGLMSMRRPGQQILAGIAIGTSASAIAGIVMSWLSNLAFALAYN
ncbi:hypothetical protein [Microbacterium phyllosphaerae]|uniref:hypothetical protein n=1 Tax=Microbacterium phyllosphaerae TaxID=124798 RepID=UPI0021697489|nr:hypothetical protein [Microbacterium phyllosphaerae]MCS3443332.1 hypothetical protein [Microbacterium phyllosphaerae]